MKVVIVDSNALGHRAKHSMKGLSYKEMETGVVFGFMQEVLRLAKQFETNRFAFAWDSRKNYRKGIYKPYKAKRTEKAKTKTKDELFLDEVAYNQFYTLRKEVLPTFGFKNNVIRTGYEADDIIASIVKNNDYNMVIASSDEDLYQLLDRADMYSFKKKKLYDSKTFTKDYNIRVDQWALVKAIAGCSSDNVIGVSGVGEKTAIKYINKELKAGRALENIQSANEIIQENMKLVSLPLCLEEEMEKVLLDFEHDRFLLSDFLSICDEYGFYSFKKDINEWNRTFKMK